MTDTNIGQTHWDGCWEDHPKCADFYARAAWSQYLSDGSKASYERYVMYKQATHDTFYEKVSASGTRRNGDCMSYSEDHLKRLAARLLEWADNEEMINQYYTEHGKDCRYAAEELFRLADLED